MDETTKNYIDQNLNSLYKATQKNLARTIEELKKTNPENPAIKIREMKETLEILQTVITDLKENITQIKQTQEEIQEKTNNLEMDEFKRDLAVRLKSIDRKFRDLDMDITQLKNKPP